MFNDDYREDRRRFDHEPRYAGARGRFDDEPRYADDRGDSRWRDEGPTPHERRGFDDRGRDEDRSERERGRFDFGRPDRRYSLEDTRRSLPREETERLIASDKVEGAAVYDMHGRRIGEVKNFMVQKRSGQVEYAVVRVRGGFLAGETYRPVDWAALRYDDRLDGYQIDLERSELRGDRSFEQWR